MSKIPCVSAVASKVGVLKHFSRKLLEGLSGFESPSEGPRIRLCFPVHVPDGNLAAVRAELIVQFRLRHLHRVGADTSRIAVQNCLLRKLRDFVLSAPVVVKPFLAQIPTP